MQICFYQQQQRAVERTRFCKQLFSKLRRRSKREIAGRLVAAERERVHSQKTSTMKSFKMFIFLFGVSGVSGRAAGGGFSVGEGGTNHRCVAWGGEGVCWTPTCPL